MSRDWTEQIFADFEKINIDDIIKEKDEQIERLQERLKEAESVIFAYQAHLSYTNSTSLVLDNYVKKWWGVK